MGLTWWPVAVTGLACLMLVVAAALWLSDNRTRRGGQPMAHTERLTRLPEYRAVVRRRTRATAVALVCVTLLFLATLAVGSRPSAPLSEASAPRDDIMLCIGQPDTERPTGEFLGYFARQATTYSTERIGLTSVNRRLIPLTRDYPFAAGRLGDYARPLQTRIESFSAPVTYDDYAPTVADVLALCLTGFPDFQTEGDTRRSMIYLGPGALRAPDDTRPSLYTDARVTEMAHRGGIQINAVATAGRQTDELASVTGATHGTLLRYDSGGIDRQLDAIRADPPPVDTRGADRRRDTPEAGLLAALALAMVLGVSMMAVRR